MNRIKIFRNYLQNHNITDQPYLVHTQSMIINNRAFIVLSQGSRCVLAYFLHFVLLTLPIIFLLNSNFPLVSCYQPVTNPCIAFSRQKFITITIIISSSCLFLLQKVWICNSPPIQCVFSRSSKILVIFSLYQ